MGHGAHRCMAVNTTASAQDGVEPIKVASACLGHAMSSIPWIPVPSLFSNMALGYQTDLEASFAYYVGVASTLSSPVSIRHSAQ